MAKICPNCGKNNLDSAKFCEDCGTALSVIENTSEYGNAQKNEQSAKPTNIVDQMKSWWDARDTKGKAVTGVIACCLGVILIVGLIGMVSSDKNLTDIQLSNAVYDGSGEYHLDIDNATTDLVINGNTEVGAAVNITSSELNITNQKVNIDSNNTFKYKLKIPSNVNEVKVRFDAAKYGKDDSYIELTIKRPSAQVTEPTTTTSTPVETESQYKASCKAISFKQLEKNPENYAGQRVKYTGTVVQIMEGYGSTDIRMDVNGNYGDTIYVTYDGTTSAVEDDTMTIYGEVYGSYTYESQAGWQITLPRITAKYVDVK